MNTHDAPERPAVYVESLDTPVPRSPRNRRRTTRRTLERHRRKCAICHHPDREAIDEAYIHWVAPSEIVHRYQLTSCVALYRHCMATGLSQRRTGKMRYALERIIEQAGNANPSADAVIRAIRANSCINDDGRWIEPPKHLIIEHRSITASQPLPATPTKTITMDHNQPLPNRDALPEDQNLIDTLTIRKLCNSNKINDGGNF